MSSLPVMASAQKMMGNDHVMAAQEKTETAIGGFCPVCVIKGMAMKGSDNFVTVYKGKLYKFAGFEQQKMFLDNPEMFTNGLEEKYEQLKK